ncbi:ABC transporter permease [Paucilactobacillus oligofermentans DSM 15707 = LMG 22743]|uniref:ABC transporter permease n=1 Tax=Paucilactobacillus oligofermentans DSM 15707 = LMG 22743 TaxID=1423778 RepID=A0A0R1RE67_9LACO|nr:ABC transporter permease subunit [Paucilactobacillus oligofermentans]KRL55159.1 ABC transporter permease [Paucilactobacillus oligofermentans DSM 15707 = LMG 22743]CUS25852.1 Aliphatic sulfonates transport permease protein SsuC [Paucilactobacillus oligofermentans DSM 15707 = LMG 22743]
MQTLEENPHNIKINLAKILTNLLHYLLPWTIPTLIIISWQLASINGLIESTILPSPWQVVQTTITSLQSGVLEQNMAISLYRALSGFVIGGSIGFLLALCTSLSQTLNLLLDSSVQMLRNIPHLALIPLVILWFGVGESSKISLVTIGVLFPIYINTYHGIRSVDSNLIEMGHSYQLNSWQLFWHIIIPGALPTILMGVRYALGVMWTTLIVSETLASSAGIGYMSTNAQSFMDMSTILMCIMIYALLGKLSDLMAKSLETSLLNWQIKGGMING